MSWICASRIISLFFLYKLQQPDISEDNALGLNRLIVAFYVLIEAFAYIGLSFISKLLQNLQMYIYFSLISNRFQYYD